MTLPADRYIERALEAADYGRGYLEQVKSGPEGWPTIMELSRLYSTYEPTDPPEPPEVKAAREAYKATYSLASNTQLERGDYDKSDFIRGALAGWAACLTHQKEQERA